MSDLRRVKLPFYDGIIEFFMLGAAHSKFAHVVGYLVTTLLLENGIEQVCRVGRLRSPEQIYEKITVSEPPGLDALNLELLKSESLKLRVLDKKAIEPSCRSLHLF